MPFDFINALALFQGLINDVLRDILDKFVFIYLDDILLFSWSEQDHVQYICEVL